MLTEIGLWAVCCCCCTALAMQLIAGSKKSATSVLQDLGDMSNRLQDNQIY